MTLTGVAVLLVEPSAFKPQNPSKVSRNRPSGGLPKRLPPSDQPAGRALEAKATSAARTAARKYAEAHGLKRGSHAASHDAPPTGEHPPPDPDAADEGLSIFVQSTQCRRKVWAAIYDCDNLLGMPFLLSLSSLLHGHLADASHCSLKPHPLSAAVIYAVRHCST